MKGEGRRASGEGQRGSALIITLLLVTVLVALVTEFAYEVYIDTTSLSNWEQAQKASYVARSGQTLSTRYLKEMDKSSYTYEQDTELPVDIDFGPGISLKVQIEDENAKFNINSLILPNGKTDDKALATLKKLFEYLNINSDFALVLADWIDPDNEPRLPDSEDNAKNAPFWSIEEIKLTVKIDNKIFDTVRPFITVFGNNRINMNTAKLPVLASLKDMDEALAKNIINYRETIPFEDLSWITRVQGLEGKGSYFTDRNYFTIKSSTFRITSTANVNEIIRTIESIMDTSTNIAFWKEV